MRRSADQMKESRMRVERMARERDRLKALVRRMVVVLKGVDGEQVKELIKEAEELL